MLHDPKTLAADTGGTWYGPAPRGIAGFGIDSRHLRAGEVFVALRTERRDGHDFVGDALRAGATAALVARVVPGVEIPQLVVRDPATALAEAARAHRARFLGPVAGVTGSAGKTTTKELLRLLLGGERSHATAGNLNNHLGLPLTLLALDPGRHEAAVLEMGMNRPGEIAALAALGKPDHGIVTTVGPAHLEAFEDLEGIAREKSDLLRAVPAGGTRVFPADLLAHPAFAEIAEGAVLVGVDWEGRGVASAARVVAQVPRAASPAVPLRVLIEDRDSGDRAALELASGGPGLVSNLAAAMALASRVLGMPFASLAPRLAGWAPPPLRGEWRDLPNGRWFVDCYNANPSSMREAAAVFGRACPGVGGPRLWILGTMFELGTTSPALHRATGADLGVAPGDSVAIVGSGPDADALAEGVISSGVATPRLHRAATAAEVTDLAAGFRGPVFLKGSRAHRLETVVPGLAASSTH